MVHTRSWLLSKLDKISEAFVTSTQDLHAQVAQIRKTVELELLTTLNRWWEDVPEADQQLFLRHRDDDPVPAGVIVLLSASGQMVLQTRFEQASGYRWPQDLSTFLQLRDLGA